MFYRSPITFLSLAFIGIATMLSSCAKGIHVARHQPIERSAAVGSKGFEKRVADVVKMPWTSGNHIETLVNGHEIFPAMLNDIRAARKTINFETYVFTNGQMAEQFVSAFCERSLAGVKVQLVLDSVGAMDMGDENHQRMVKAGVDVRFYHPLSLRNLLRYNIRDHRKIMVVDGAVGYSGGCGIADAWMGNAESPQHWRENHYRITGPVVGQLQRNFNDHWVKCGGKSLSGPDYFPSLSHKGSMKAHAYNSSPIEKRYTIPHTYRQAIASARKSITIKNSYFYLDRPMLKAINDASQRGVHVELILAWEHTDAWPVRHLSIYQYHKLLKAGVHIYEYRPTMIHCKVMVVDEIFSIIGSANFDPRSLYINDESNINVLDKDFAQEQLQIISEDKLSSKRVIKPPFFWNPLTMPSRAAVTIIAPQL